MRRGKKKNVKLDEIDYRLLCQLEEDSALSMAELSEMLKVPQRKIEYRVNRLTKNGIITHFIAVLDYSKLGYFNHELWIQLGDVSPEKREKFKNYLVRHPRIWWVASCGGKFDYGVAILAENVVEFSKIIDQIISDNKVLSPRTLVTIPTKVRAYNRTYLLPHPETKRSRGMKHFFSGTPRPVLLDDVARKVLFLLSKDAKMPVNEIAKKVGVSPNTVRARIKWLEKTKVIQGYRAMIQPAAIGMQNYELLVSTRGLSTETEKEVEEYCKNNPYVVYMLSTLGKFNIDIVMDAEDTEHFQNMLREFRTKFKNVIWDYEYVPILKVYKFGLELDL
jgi:Lrp/AsnC family transcriptional regulator, leucine-responsive regulatory protein